VTTITGRCEEHGGEGMHSRAGSANWTDPGPRALDGARQSRSMSIWPPLARG